MEKKSYNVYIVDDSKIIAEILKKVISSISAIEAKDFCTGELMLEELKTNVPDMIFLDYYLYDDGRKMIDNSTIMNGDLVLNEIKKQHPNMPVVLLTSMSDEDKINELKKLGFCCVIRKDGDDIYTEVLSCIDTHLNISE